MIKTREENLQFFNEQILKNSATIPRCIYFVVQDGKTFKESFLINLNRLKGEGDIIQDHQELINLPNFSWEVFESIFGVNEEQFLEPLIDE